VTNIQEFWLLIICSDVWFALQAAGARNKGTAMRKI